MWKDDYSVGVKEIDFQHKYFLKIINRFFLSHKLLAEKNLIHDMISEIIFYARFHFRSEENIMKLIDYPDLNVHKGLHIDLINQLNPVSYMGNESTEGVNELISFLFDWFLKHTVNQDKKIFEYIKNTNPQKFDRLLHFRETL